MNSFKSALVLFFLFFIFNACSKSSKPEDEISEKDIIKKGTMYDGLLNPTAYKYVAAEKDGVIFAAFESSMLLNQETDSQKVAFISNAVAKTINDVLESTEISLIDIVNVQLKKDGYIVLKGKNCTYEVKIHMTPDRLKGFEYKKCP
ncbi:MAG TPA: hypothetical protein VHP32_08610 [Ignavibacteria bacterium]|nr:hypothetical protein [Ignavibacteria bacterium]